MTPKMEESLREWFADAVLQTPAGTLKIIDLLDALDAERAKVLEVEDHLWRLAKKAAELEEKP